MRQYNLVNVVLRRLDVGKGVRRKSDEQCWFLNVIGHDRYNFHVICVYRGFFNYDVLLLVLKCGMN